MNINEQIRNTWASSIRGADMGRPNWGLPEDRETPMVMYLQRVKLDVGGYDLGGAYWGLGDPLFCAWSSTFYAGSLPVCARVFVRAKTRDAAKTQIKQHFTNAKFFR